MTRETLVSRITSPVLGASIDAISWDDALQRLQQWTSARESRYVCICNVHSAVTASQDPAFARAIEQADMATPDGAPIAWMLRRLGHTDQQRISGPDLMLRHCELAASSGTAVCLYGSTPDTLRALQQKLHERFPSLRIVDAISPPFRALSDQEDAEIVDRINKSKAQIVWVSLGCPKQEFWMAAHRGRVEAVMVGVGAAFDFHAGTVSRAPRWMREYGMEWLHRLASEPRRLWRRYLFTNTAFIFGAACQLLFHRN